MLSGAGETRAAQRCGTMRRALPVRRLPAGRQAVHAHRAGRARPRRAPGVRAAPPPDRQPRPGRVEGGAARHDLGRPVRVRVGAHLTGQGRPAGGRRRRPGPAGHQDGPRPRLPVRRRRPHRRRPAPAGAAPAAQRAHRPGPRHRRRRRADPRRAAGDDHRARRHRQDDRRPGGRRPPRRPSTPTASCSSTSSPVPPQARRDASRGRGRGRRGRRRPRRSSGVADHLAEPARPAGARQLRARPRAGRPQLVDRMLERGRRRRTSSPPAGSRSASPASTCGRSARSTTRGRRCSSSGPGPPSPGCAGTRPTRR